MNSQQVDPSWCLAPVGIRCRKCCGGHWCGRRGRLTVWLIGKKSSSRRRINKTNMMFNEFEELWRIWTATVVRGDADWHVYLSFGREEERGQGKLRCDSSQAGELLYSLCPKSNNSRVGFHFFIFSYFFERSDTSDKTWMELNTLQDKHLDLSIYPNMIDFKDIPENTVKYLDPDAWRPQ